MFRAIARPATPVTPPTPPPTATPPTPPPATSTATPAVKKDEKKKKEKVGLLERTMAPPSVARSLGTGAAVLIGSTLLAGIILASVVAMCMAALVGGTAILQSLQ
jgi:hypothetical protein